jgi:hypothetical protein
MNDPLPPQARLDLTLAAIIRPVLSSMAEAERIPHSTAAERMLLAIGWQESRFLYRDQVDTGPAVMGPATGFWQFERTGGVQGVMRHHATRFPALGRVAMAGVAFDAQAIWAAFTEARHDRLACAFARLLLWSDPHPLPASEARAWDYYLRTWRPGKPHAKTWPEAWRRADDALRQMPLQIPPP